MLGDGEPVPGGRFTLRTVLLAASSQLLIMSVPNGGRAARLVPVDPLDDALRRAHAPFL
jgi:hypothetical protein